MSLNPTLASVGKSFHSISFPNEWGEGSEKNSSSNRRKVVSTQLVSPTSGELKRKL